jgi:hypothetical protein
MKAWLKFAMILALVLLSVPLAAAQNYDKEIRNPVLPVPVTAERQLEYVGRFRWTAPTKTDKLKDYHVRWTVNRRDQWDSCGVFRGLKKENTATKGNAFVTATAFFLPSVRVRWGETLVVSVRARYRGEANGRFRGARWMNDGYPSNAAGDRFRANQLPAGHPDSPNNNNIGEWPEDWSCPGISESNS